MSTYRVRCERTDGAWLVTTLPADRGIRTRCARLDEVADAFAQAAQRATGEPPAQIRVQIVEVAGVPEFKDTIVITEEPHRMAAEAAAAVQRETRRVTGVHQYAAPDTVHPYRDLAPVPVRR